MPTVCSRHPEARLESKAFRSAPLWRLEIVTYCPACFAEHVLAHGTPRPWEGPTSYEVQDGAALLRDATRWLR